MFIVKLFLYSVVAAVTLADDINNKAFPEDFWFGTATASYQVEGGWNADGKGENIWDRITRVEPNYTSDGSNGDVACDSYYKYKEDVALLKELGVHHYRFSLSWSRILPTGFSNEINQAGVDYYKNLIAELRANDIEPLVTIFHWDTPQPLQDAGGFPNELMVDWFADYARVVFSLFGDSVKYWMTFNEPKQTCQQGYGSFEKAPAINSSGIGEYLCAHNLLKAHAKAWHIYDEEFRAKQNGYVGIVIDSGWFRPETNSTADETAAETKRQFTFGWYANPLFNGDYPEIMKQKIASRSKVQGFSKSRLPEFTEEEIAYLKGTVDVLGVNSYTGELVRAIPNPEKLMWGWEADSEVFDYQPDDWPNSASSWLKVTPWAIRGLLNWVKNMYKSPRIIITENGFSDKGTSLEDDDRISFYQKYLSNVRDAMEVDGVNVTGYTAWSLMDNFEWKMGYSEKFGLYHVDFNSPNRTRTPKKSARYFAKVIKTRCIVDSCT